jgi:hypothetical protein
MVEIWLWRRIPEPKRNCDSGISGGETVTSLSLHLRGMRAGWRSCLKNC